MTTNRRRTATLTVTVAALALTTGLLTACDPTDTSDASNSLNCLKSWTTITDSLQEIHDTGAAAAKDPTKSDEAISTLEKNLDKIGSDSDDSKVDKAVDDLDKAISDYNKSILNGDTNPDSSKIDAAADRLKNVCTS